MREQLFKRLDAGLSRNLTLVSAPAGFGKTTLLATWLRERRHAAAWVSLDGSDNDASSFLNDVTAAINVQFSDVCRDLRTMLQMTDTMPPDLLASLLSNELGDLPDDLVLVLDDYHVVEDPGVHAVINELVSRPPRHLHVVIAARFDPPLPLARLRGGGQIVELRARDLRFDDNETAEFLTRAFGRHLDPAAVSSLHARTEGWVAGLHLAALSLADEPEPAAFAMSFNDDNRQIADFLMDEVLTRLPRPVYDFLLTTSIVERMTGPLCDALLESGGGGQEMAGSAILNWADRAGLFITALDDNGGWYRYHHLFRQLLRQELRGHLDPEAVLALHRRAGDWFASHGLLAEALEHLLAAGDPEAAAQMVEERVHPMLNREAWPELGRLLDALPEAVRQRPGLVVARAWLLHFTGQGARIPALLASSEELLRGEHGRASTDVLADADVLLALSRALDGNAVEGLEHARKSLARMPAEHAFARGFAEFFLAVHLRFVGRGSDAVAMLNRALMECLDRKSARTGRVLLGLIWGELAGGNLHAVERLARLQRDNGE